MKHGICRNDMPGSLIALLMLTTWTIGVATASTPGIVPGTRFEATRAQRYLSDLCRLGPRITGSEGMKRQQELLCRHFEALGARVVRQEFQATQPSLAGRTIACTNLVVHWHPGSRRRILLGAHYDTRPRADEEPIYRRQRTPFLGANDGASGVALLMELGNVLPTLDIKVAVDFVFFDAEEYILSKRRDRYFIGSQYFAQDLVRRREQRLYEAVVVVDMIGDLDLQIHPDQRSATRAGRLVADVWQAAADLGIREFRPRVKYDVLDDHLSLQAIGIPAIVLIDFDYPHWHRLTDTPDKCSGESLDKVARVLIEWLRRQSHK